jgi:hypothetical protein
MTDEELLSKASEFVLMEFDPTDHRPIPRIRSVRVARRFRIKNIPTWAIYDDCNSCLNHDGQWEYEPQPSSRTDEFLARCQWFDRDEAIQFTQNYMEKYPSGYRPEDIL